MRLKVVLPSSRSLRTLLRDSYDERSESEKMSGLEKQSRERRRDGKKLVE
jgi:hypothetical protein